MSKLRRPKKAQSRLEARRKDFAETVSRIKKAGENSDGYKQPGSSRK